MQLLRLKNNGATCRDLKLSSVLCVLHLSRLNLPDWDCIKWLQRETVSEGGPGVACDVSQERNYALIEFLSFIFIFLKLEKARRGRVHT